MKKLSDALADLQAKVKEAQQSAKDMIEENDAMLQERWLRSQEAIRAQGERFDASVEEMDESARQWGRDVRGAVDGQYRKVSDDIARRRAESDVAAAEDAAVLAEEYAAAVSELGRYTVQHAEDAAIQAAQARAEAFVLREKLTSAS